MEILRTDKVTNEPWLNLFVRHYRRHGTEGRWVFASRRDDPAVPARQVDGVVVAAVLTDPGRPPRLVVTKEYRVPIGDYEYGFPAGITDAGEGVEETARRELREETGLELVEVRRVSPPTFSSSGLTDECVVVVFATARTPPDCRQRLDETEDIEVLLLDHAQVCALCDAPVRFNGRVWPILAMYQQLGKLL